MHAALSKRVNNYAPVLQSYIITTHLVWEEMFTSITYFQFTTLAIRAKPGPQTADTIHNVCTALLLTFVKRF